MSDATSIEWTDATWNPVRGCTRVSEGCRFCYAERVAVRWSEPGQWGHGFARSTPAGPRWTGRVELVPSKLSDPLRWRRPRRVFVNSTSDLFHDSLAYGYIAAVYGVMAEAERHTFQVLTKRPQVARDWCRWAERLPHIQDDRLRRGAPVTGYLATSAAPARSRNSCRSLCRGRRCTTGRNAVEGSTSAGHALELDGPWATSKGAPRIGDFVVYGDREVTRDDVLAALRALRVTGESAGLVP